MTLPTTTSTSENCISSRAVKKWVKKNKQSKQLSEQAIPVIFPRSCGSGKGSSFDHRTIQHITGEPTALYSATTDNPLVKTFQNHYVNNDVFDFPHSDKRENSINGRPFPPVVDDANPQKGTLIIPGKHSKTKISSEQLVKESQSIRLALLQGQPIVGICGGAWQLFKQLVEQEKLQTIDKNKRWPDLLDSSDFLDINHHNYGGGMPRIGAEGYVVCNAPVHELRIEKDSLLASAMTLTSNKFDTETLTTVTDTDIEDGRRRITVNSVHPKVINPKNKPSSVKISALSYFNRQDEAGQKGLLKPLKTRQGELMQPERCVEAFEIESGAPVLGIQWHPEAYTPLRLTKKQFDSTAIKDFEERNTASQGALIQYMAKAGEAFRHRRALLTEFQDAVRNCKTK